MSPSLLLKAQKRPLLLCSLGNPGSAYAYTRHNAGHVMLDIYREVMRYPEFSQDKKLSGSVSQKDHIRLFRSATYMNESGSAVAKAFRDFKRTAPDGVLCVVHDEMESKLGNVKLRLSGKGKGHNGIRSCIKHLGTAEFSRLAIGISRPESREPAIVTQWVLGRFTNEESQRLREEGLFGVIKAIDQLSLNQA